MKGVLYFTQITKVKITCGLVDNLQKRFGSEKIVGIKDSSGDIKH